MGVKNVFIEKYLNFYLPSNFLGCYSCDMLNNIFLKNKECIVVNTAPSHEKVGHFITIQKEGNSLIYFDPLNLSLNHFVQTFIDSQKAFFLDTDQQIQSFSSKKCAHFCIAFLLSQKFVDFNDFFCYFDKSNFEKNDKIVDKLLFLIKNHW